MNLWKCYGKMSKIIFLFFFSGHSFLCFPYPIIKIMLFFRASDSDLLIPVQESSRLRRISKFGWHLLLGFRFGLWLFIPGCLVNHFEAPFFTDSQHGIYHHLKNHPFANLRMWMHHLWQGLKVPNWNQVRWEKLGSPVGSWDQWLHLWPISPTYRGYNYPLITPLILTSWHIQVVEVLGWRTARNVGWWFCWW